MLAIKQKDDDKICIDKRSVTSNLGGEKGGHRAAFTEPVVATGRPRAFRLSRAGLVHSALNTEPSNAMAIYSVA